MIHKNIFCDDYYDGWRDAKGQLRKIIFWCLISRSLQCHNKKFIIIPPPSMQSDKIQPLLNKVCYMSNAFTSRKAKLLNFPALNKLYQLKIHQKQNQTSFKFRIHDQKEARKQLRDHFATSIRNSNYLKTEEDFVNHHRVNDKIINNVSSFSHKKQYSSLEKCLKDTETYDKLKNEVVCRIKLKKSLARSKKSNHSPSVIYNRLYRKTLFQSERKQNTNARKTCRYADLSVSEFMEEDESYINPSICKKFYELRRETPRPRAYTQ